MKKNSYITISNVLSTIEFEGKDAIMEELNTEINRGADAKAAKDAEYETAWEVVYNALIQTKSPLSVAEIFKEIENDLPEGFSKGKVQYGLTHQWEDKIVKIEGKPNTYRLK